MMGTFGTFSFYISSVYHICLIQGRVRGVCSVSAPLCKKKVVHIQILGPLHPTSQGPLKSALLNIGDGGEDIRIVTEYNI